MEPEVNNLKRSNPFQCQDVTESVKKPKNRRRNSSEIAFLAPESNNLNQVENTLKDQDYRFSIIETFCEEHTQEFWVEHTQESSTPEETPVVTPPKVMAIFQDLNLTVPKDEVNTIERNYDFYRKAETEKKKIAEQMRAENLKFQIQREVSPLDELEKMTLENVDRDSTFISQKSPLHQNEDRATQFTIKVGEESFPGFAIFDGHGGNEASTFCKEKIGETLQKCVDHFVTSGADFEVYNALKIAFVLLDAYFAGYREKHNLPKYPGCAAICALFFRGELFVANAGDSRAILILDDEILQLSYDYNASQKYALKSVAKRGGTIQKGRVLNDNETNRMIRSLAMTRAIGDDHLRKTDGIKPVTPRPKITMIDFNNTIDGLKLFENKNIQLLLCSDGLTEFYIDSKTTDFFSTKAIGRAVQSLRDTKTPLEIAEILIKEARKRGSKDDITIGLIDVKRLMVLDQAQTHL